MAEWRHRLFVMAPALMVGLLALTTPGDDGPTVCPFALCTGMACPGCGMTRAASHLVRGNFDVAFSYHPLVVLIALQVVGGWAWYMLRRAGKVRPMSQTTFNVVLIATAVSLLAVWAIRLATGTLPSV